MLQRNLQQRVLRSGYLADNEKYYRLWNLVLITPVLIVSLPVFLLLYLVLLFIQGFPVFYKGVRLGKNKKQFIIYKFRSLKVNAELRLKDHVLPTRSGLETPLGKFLRESRLDELPQFFNILRGDMNFIGPRPVRMEIAKLAGSAIKDYDIRFSVKPGLVGYTQLFTTHRTPKKIRAKFNSYFCRRRAIFWKEPFILAVTVGGMLRKMCFFVRIRLLSLIKSGRLMTRRMEVRLRLGKAEVTLKRDFDQVASNALPNKGTTVTATRDGNVTKSCFFLDINDEAFSFLSPAPVYGEKNMFLLELKTSCPKKLIKARCFGKVVERDISISASRFRSTKNKDCISKHLFLVYYTPVTDLDYYKIDKYFLNNSILR